MTKKSFALILALVMLVGCLVGSTVAWLTTKTDPITNTFTVGKINITLAESENLNLKMIPGCDITKDPKATVVAGSEECWLFVKIEKSANFDTYMTYDVADGWTKLDGVSNVYCRKVTTKDMGKAFDILKDNKVTVLDSVTATRMTNAENNKPTLTFTAYASQLANGTTEFTAAKAWENLSK